MKFLTRNQSRQQQQQAAANHLLPRREKILERIGDRVIVAFFADRE